GRRQRPCSADNQVDGPEDVMRAGEPLHAARHRGRKSRFLQAEMVDDGFGFVVQSGIDDNHDTIVNEPDRRGQREHVVRFCLWKWLHAVERIHGTPARRSRRIPEAVWAALREAVWSSILPKNSVKKQDCSGIMQFRDMEQLLLIENFN